MMSIVPFQIWFRMENWLEGEENFDTLALKTMDVPFPRTIGAVAEAGGVGEQRGKCVFDLGPFVKLLSRLECCEFTVHCSKILLPFAIFATFCLKILRGTLSQEHILNRRSRRTQRKKDKGRSYIFSPNWGERLVHS